MAVLTAYLDECVDPRVAEGLVQRGFRATTATAEGTLGFRDDMQLAYALEHDFLLVSHDQPDFRRWHPILDVCRQKAPEAVQKTAEYTLVRAGLLVAMGELKRADAILREACAQAVRGDSKPSRIMGARAPGTRVRASGGSSAAQRTPTRASRPDSARADATTDGAVTYR